MAEEDDLPADLRLQSARRDHLCIKKPPREKTAGLLAEANHGGHDRAQLRWPRLEAQWGEVASGCLAGRRNSRPAAPRIPRMVWMGGGSRTSVPDHPRHPWSVFPNFAGLPGASEAALNRTKI